MAIRYFRISGKGLGSRMSDYVTWYDLIDVADDDQLYLALLAKFEQQWLQEDMERQSIEYEQMAEVIDYYAY